MCLALYVALDCTGSVLVIYGVWRDLWLVLATNQVRYVSVMVTQFVTTLSFVEVYKHVDDNVARFNKDAMAFTLLRTMAGQVDLRELDRVLMWRLVFFTAYDDTSDAHSEVATHLATLYGITVGVAGVLWWALPSEKDHVHQWVTQGRRYPRVALLVLIAAIVKSMCFLL
ncbi:hypothetical protein DYB37_005174 [Aphanomyces astaci]|uniref:Uncharacterized protein n=1 Tax=Aphanomyces astaci TaxID=112090 RepID=A0A397DIG3_APHAT|nr:hypothetical protein AaE_012581 [Aphanomyces astaci]RHY27658.1 hypothetical protein DYB25_005386 [Aphanomyces astaci]RHY63259.1 hypothetical protein DYB38_002762 [Aphanomyces astaci]RHY64235.1 hypothetical protein DYB34_006310 [Aphanomyces astaci]RHY75492.1 hypothetical protein DYB30_004044 [Aphanomyces astaci]